MDTKIAGSHHAKGNRLYCYPWFNGRRDSNEVTPFGSKRYSPRKLMCSHPNGDMCFNKSSRNTPLPRSRSVALPRYTVFLTLIALIRMFKALARLILKKHVLSTPHVSRRKWLEPGRSLLLLYLGRYSVNIVPSSG